MDKKKMFLNLSLLLLFISLFFYMYNGSIERKNSLKDSNVEYSIGKINKLKYGNRPPIFIYYFRINNKRNDSLKGVYTINDEKRGFSKSKLNNYLYKYFLIKFNKKKPNYNQLLFNKSVPDSLIKCCHNHIWDTIPF